MSETEIDILRREIESLQGLVSAYDQDAATLRLENNLLQRKVDELAAENEKLKQSQREQAGWRRPDVEEPATWGCPECGAEDWPKYRVSCACGYRRPSSQVMNLR